MSTAHVTSSPEVAPILKIRDLKMYFPVKKGAFSRERGEVKAVDGVSFDIIQGETLGLVGESGCGKTTIGRSIMRVYNPTSGTMEYRSGSGSAVDLAKVQGKDLKGVRKEIRMVFQDPHASLNPRMTLRDIIAEPLRAYGRDKGSSLNDQVASLLKRVGLRPEYMRRYPHAFSGGERQRVGIARALATNPRLLVADEPVSALDVSVRAQIINLLRDLQGELGLTYLFISHDLSVVEHICDRVAVMYLGRIVELAETSRIFASPKMPYTESLLSAVPAPRGRGGAGGRRTRGGRGRAGAGGGRARRRGLAGPERAPRRPAGRPEGEPAGPTPPRPPKSPPPAEAHGRRTAEGPRPYK